MVPVMSSKTSDDRTIKNTHMIINDSQFGTHTENQQWGLLSKSLEIYFLWLLSMMVIYALAFALLMYIRNSKEEKKTNSGKCSENDQNSDNTVVSMNDKDLYPILNLAGDQSTFYLKYLDVKRIPKTKKSESQEINKQEKWRVNDKRDDIDP